MDENIRNRTAVQSDSFVLSFSVLSSKCIIVDDRSVSHDLMVLFFCEMSTLACTIVCRYATRSLV